MSTQQTQVAALGFSPWLTLDATQSAFDVGFNVMLTPAASMTYSVQQTSDSFGRVREVFLTRAGTVATLSFPDHRLSAGDYVKVISGNVVAGDVFDGEFAVASVVDANNITYTVANAGSTVGNLGAKAVFIRVFPHPTVVTLTANAFSACDFPVTGIRLITTIYASGTASLTTNQGRK